MTKSDRPSDKDLCKKLPEKVDPYVDKMRPKVVLKVHWVFNPKYEDVAIDHYGIDEKKQPYGYRVP